MGLLLACLSLMAQVREKETPQTREEKVRDVLEKFNLAYQERDANALSHLVTPGLAVFAGGKAFTSWEDYRDNFLNATFTRPMPPSTWEVEKVVTSPEMAWAYTKTHYTMHRQAQTVQADLYQVFVLQKGASSPTTRTTASGAQADWKIAVIDYSFHRDTPASQMRPENPPQGSQPQ